MQNIEKESLEAVFEKLNDSKIKAAKDYVDTNFSRFEKSSPTWTALISFESGAEWQKEKDRVVIDKLTAFIEGMSKRYERSEWIGGEAKKLLQSLKQI
jgi:hypothetical protein